MLQSHRVHITSNVTDTNNVKTACNSMSKYKNETGRYNKIL